MVALPRAVYAHPGTSILTRLRIVGAVVVVQDGQVSIRNASRVPTALMAEARARRDDLIAELTGEAGAVTIPCTRCSTQSRPFAEVINADLWLCDGCWPANPDDAAHDQTERAAIVAEGDASAPVLHDMPVSWADIGIEPTRGARCRNCVGLIWWTESVDPKGWRCTRCHPSTHLPPAAVRVVVT